MCRVGVKNIKEIGVILRQYVYVILLFNTMIEETKIETAIDKGQLIETKAAKKTKEA